jgi:ferritin-like metal-binding protein YciE
MMAEEKNTSAFAQQLQRLWSIESQLVEAMPVMIEKANNFGLKKNLALHFEETRQQQVGIEAICKGLDIDPQSGDKDTELQQLLQQGEQKMMSLSGDELDAAIIEAARQIEVHEMRAYVPAAEAIKAAGYEGYAARLYLTLEQERQAETKLKFLEKSLFATSALIGEKMQGAT